MKSERRHELQTNYLADHLGTAVNTGKPYATYVIGGIVVALFAALAYGIYSSQVSKANAAAWGDYYFNLGSGDAEIFQQVAQDHAGTSAALWSKQAWADNKLLEGLEQLYTDRKLAEETINKAIDSYEEVANKSYESDLKNRAAMGMAQAYESIGKLDDATKYYKQVAAGSQDGFATMANNRLAWLASGEGKSFYEWFASVKSTPVAKPNIPADLSKPPAAPDINFSEMPKAPEAGAAPTELPGAPVPPAAPAPTTPAIPTAPSESATPAPANPPATDSAPPAATPSEPKTDSTPAAPTPAEPADQPPK